MYFKALIVVVAIALALGPTAPVLAGGPADTACLTDNASAGATALRGTLAVHVQQVLQGSTAVDFTLRLDKGGTVTFFRTSYETIVFGRSNEAILCELLVDSNSPTAATDFRAAIINSFALKRSTRFVLTRKSLSQAETQGETGQWFCTGVYTDPETTAPPCGAAARGGSMLDVTLYAQ